MEAIKEIRHVTGNKLQIYLPPSFNNQDVEVIILPSSKKQKKDFSPSAYYGITNQPASQIMEDAAQLRDEWERR